MHGLEIIKALNANRDESNQLPHNGPQFDSANNKGGIQGHSQGPVFPINEHTIGDDVFVSKAPFAPECELRASDSNGQRRNSYRLKRLEKLADDICEIAAREHGGRFQVSYVKSGINEDKGYLVVLDGFNKKISTQRCYAEVYKYLFDHRELLSSGHCVGGLVAQGRIYLGVFAWCEDLAEAQEVARERGQNIIWDCEDKTILFES